MFEKSEKYPHYKHPKKVEEFYRKPETHEELVDRIKILREIPEDKTDPKVIIKFGDPTKSHKFIFAQDEKERSYLIALPVEKYRMHYSIKKLSEKLYKKKLDVLGGGYVRGDIEHNKIIISRNSGDYGYVHKTEIKDILERKFPDIKIEVDTPNGKIIKERKTLLEIIQKEEGSAILNSLSCATPEILNNKEIILKAIKRVSDRANEVLKLASKELRGDKEVVLEAVKKDGNSLQFATEELRGDKEVVLEAVKKDGNSLQFAAEELRGDKEVN